MDEQCDVVWHIPHGVEPISLFHTTSFYVDRDSIDLMGGPDGKQFTFEVSVSHVPILCALGILGALEIHCP